MVARGHQGVKWMELLRIGENTLLLFFCTFESQYLLNLKANQSFAIQSGLLVPVSCAVGHHVRNSLLLCAQIHSEQGKILP